MNDDMMYDPIEIEYPDLYNNLGNDKKKYNHTIDQINFYFFIHI